MAYNPFASKESQRMMRLGGRYSVVGLEIALGFGAGIAGGNWLDARWDMAPLFFYVGLVLAVGNAVNSVYRVVKGTKLDDL